MGRIALHIHLNALKHIELQRGCLLETQGIRDGFRAAPAALWKRARRVVAGQDCPGARRLLKKVDDSARLAEYQVAARERPLRYVMYNMLYMLYIYYIL